MALHYMVEQHCWQHVIIRFVQTRLHKMRQTVVALALHAACRWVIHLRNSLLLAEAATAATGGIAGPEGGAAAQQDLPAKTAAALEIAATLDANRKLAVINGMGDHNRAQVRLLHLS